MDSQRTQFVDGFDYSEFTSPEHKSWKAHRELLRNIDESNAGYRGCLGLAMLIKGSNEFTMKAVTGRAFVPDSSVAWASLVDIPIGYFKRGNTRRDAHWATVRPTTMKYGLPTLERGSEKNDAWDFKQFPFSTGTIFKPEGGVFIVTAKDDILNTEEHPQLFRVFNALEWAMTSTAFAFRSTWTHAQPALSKLLGYEHTPSQKLLAFGNGIYDAVARPAMWMPKAYLAFPANLRAEIYARQTRQHIGSEIVPTYRQGLQDAFLDALGDNLEYRAHFPGVVKSVIRTVYHGMPVMEMTLKGNRGEHDVVRFFGETASIFKRTGAEFEENDVLAEERTLRSLPQNWHQRSYAARWEQWLERLLPDALDQIMNLWFDRQAVQLVDGVVHYPAVISSSAALSSAVDSGLMWEVSESMEYFRDDSDAIVFPTIQIRGWSDLAGRLPGDILYDFHPADKRYETLEEQRERVAKQRGIEEPRPKPEKFQPKAPTLIQDVPVTV